MSEEVACFESALFGRIKVYKVYSWPSHREKYYAIVETPSYETIADLASWLQQLEAKLEGGEKKNV